MRKNSSSVAIIIPMYNEEKVAHKCIVSVIREIKKIPTKISIFIVNDGSTDKTQAILNYEKRKYGMLLYIFNHKKNKGYGGALQTGISQAIKEKFDFYLTMDSDLTNPPKYIHDFIYAIEDNIDCIKASRYIKGGKMINVPLYRQLISIIGNFLASLIFNVGIRDCTNGFKLVRLSKLKGVRFKEKNFSIILEEMYILKKRKARFIEIPNILYARTNTLSHFRYRPKIFYDYFKYVLKAAFIF